MVAPGKKVLVAEADEIVLVLITHVLTRQSYIVHNSTTAEETERMLDSGGYDAVIVAPRMLDGNAGAFLRGAVERNPSLRHKMIVLTTQAEETAVFQALGVEAILRKPVEIHDLMQTVYDTVART